MQSLHVLLLVYDNVELIIYSMIVNIMNDLFYYNNVGMRL